ncbi:MAG: hypothetical protein LBQ12_04410 [Deltaproteobacteria bacterium]|jgi:hypothetical protein|nr:hypothetical protein [Deltaproteobacteria bacterium]
MKLENLMLASAGLALKRYKRNKDFALALLDRCAKIKGDSHVPNEARRHANSALQRNRIPDALRPPQPSPPPASPAPSADPADAGATLSRAKPPAAPAAKKPTGKGKKGGGTRR